jgi:hypothetical protein
MSDTREPDDVSCALVCLRRGAVLSSHGPIDGRLEGLAAAASELLLAEQGSELAPVLASLDSQEQAGALQEVVVISERHVHVVQRGHTQPDIAVVAVAELGRGLGLTLSNLRASLARESRR